MKAKVKDLTIGDKIAIFIPFILVAFVWVGLAFPPGIIQSLSYKSVVAVIACVCLWTSLRLMDLQAGIKFREWWIDEKNLHQGLYLCFRVVAYAIVVSFVFAFT